MARFMGTIFVVGGLLLWGVPTGAVAGGGPEPLATAPDSAAQDHNVEGIVEYNGTYYDEAKGHFEAAMKADPQSAEVHYNLALTLDKLGDHQAATEHFQKAYDLGKHNPAIQNSGILKAHLKMK